VSKRMNIERWHDAVFIDEYPCHNVSSFCDIRFINIFARDHPVNVK